MGGKLGKEALDSLKSESMRSINKSRSTASLADGSLILETFGSHHHASKFNQNWKALWREIERQLDKCSKIPPTRKPRYIASVQSSVALLGDTVESLCDKKAKNELLWVHEIALLHKKALVVLGKLDELLVEWSAVQQRENESWMLQIILQVQPFLNTFGTVIALILATSKYSTILNIGIAAIVAFMLVFQKDALIMYQVAWYNNRDDEAFKACNDEIDSMAQALLIDARKYEMQEVNHQGLINTLESPDAREFWISHFGIMKSSVTTQELVDAIADNNTRLSILKGVVIKDNDRGGRKAFYGMLAKAVDSFNDGVVSLRAFWNYYLHFGPCEQLVPKILQLLNLAVVPPYLRKYMLWRPQVLEPPTDHELMDMGIGTYVVMRHKSPRAFHFMFVVQVRMSPLARFRSAAKRIMFYLRYRTLLVFEEEFFLLEKYLLNNAMVGRLDSPEAGRDVPLDDRQDGGGSRGSLHVRRTQKPDIGRRGSLSLKNTVTNVRSVDAALEMQMTRKLLVYSSMRVIHLYLYNSSNGYYITDFDEQQYMNSLKAMCDPTKSAPQPPAPLMPRGSLVSSAALSCQTSSRKVKAPITPQRGSMSLLDSPVQSLLDEVILQKAGRMAEEMLRAKRANDAQWAYTPTTVSGKGWYNRIQGAVNEDKLVYTEVGNKLHAQRIPWFKKGKQHTEEKTEGIVTAPPAAAAAAVAAAAAAAAENLDGRSDGSEVGGSGGSRETTMRPARKGLRNRWNGKDNVLRTLREEDESASSAPSPSLSSSSSASSPSSPSSPSSSSSLSPFRSSISPASPTPQSSISATSSPSSLPSARLSRSEFHSLPSLSAIKEANAKGKVFIMDEIEQGSFVDMSKSLQEIQEKEGAAKEVDANEKVNGDKTSAEDQKADQEGKNKEQEDAKRKKEEEEKKMENDKASPSRVSASSEAAGDEEEEYDDHYLHADSDPLAPNEYPLPPSSVTNVHEEIQRWYWGQSKYQSVHFTDNDRAPRKFFKNIHEAICSNSFRGFLHRSYVDPDAKVKIHVSDRSFSCNMFMFAKHPQTTLGKVFSVRNSPLPTELFYDCDPIAFEVIINWYRFGSLYVSDKVNLSILAHHARMFDLPARLINTIDDMVKDHGRTS